MKFSADSEKPIFLQLAEEIEEDILKGILKRNHRSLPRPKWP